MLSEEDSPIASTIFLMCMSFLFPSLIALVVLLPKLKFRLQPIVEVANVNSAAFDVNLKRSLTNFGQGCAALAFFFCDLRPKKRCLACSDRSFSDIAISCFFSPLQLLHSGPRIQTGAVGTGDHSSGLAV